MGTSAKQILYRYFGGKTRLVHELEVLTSQFAELDGFCPKVLLEISNPTCKSTPNEHACTMSMLTTYNLTNFIHKCPAPKCMCSAPISPISLLLPLFMLIVLMLHCSLVTLILWQTRKTETIATYCTTHISTPKELYFERITTPVEWKITLHSPWPWRRFVFENDGFWISWVPQDQNLPLIEVLSVSIQHRSNSLIQPAH
jgi:hypothetical protein